MTELMHKPGFLGTAANWAADMTLVLMILIGVALTVGVVMARRQKYQTHRWIQTTSVALNVILVLWLMILPYRDFVAPGVPNLLGEPFYLVTTLHGIVGFFAFVLGVFIVLRANGLMINALKFNNYKLFMRVSYALYMLTIFLGLLVYYFWFINNPNPPTYGFLTPLSTGI
ncbi:MAG: hypothetical protein HND44_16220 [Chloroflexi bacterium]|nr:hypothetical protein [Ardenticatenaceae bacterium]MBL1130007.1 hypothetical protein [Chloroflexota bacterium]NOG36093.1 hypothetical protein [Chloroflexota bacterium]GIK58308.1 MAG: hypothetical protein BroJett015_39710 [Chloroflexota bacterium]